MPRPKLTKEDLVKIHEKYKLLKTFLKVDRSLQKQGVWGFISSSQLPDVIRFVELYEEKVLKTLNLH